MHKFSTLLFILILCACSSSKQEKTFDYKGEEASVISYNSHKEKLPLVIVLPDVDGSMITEEIITRLSRQNRVIVVRFISPHNKIRQQQLDNLQNRTTYYSDQLARIAALESDSVTLVSEGLNANITSGIVNAMPINNYILVNSYYPTLKDALTIKCYAQQTNACDSIIDYLEFGYRYAIDSVFVELAKPNRDNQYGRYNTSYWKEILPLPSTPQEGLYKGKIKYLFTTNTGLAPLNLPPNTTKCPKAKLKETLASLIRS